MEHPAGHACPGMGRRWLKPTARAAAAWQYRRYMDQDTSPVQARFSQVNMVVADMGRTAEFYRLLGIEFADMSPPWDAHHRTVTTVNREVIVEVDSLPSVHNWAPEWDPRGTGVVIGVTVRSDEEVDAAVEVVRGEGHRVLQPPHDAFFGARYAVVEDPDGAGVGIMGPIDERRRWMPELPA